MGLYFVNAVLNGLKGRKLSVGKKKLTASDIAMLLNTVDGKEFAVETIAKYSKANMPGKSSLELILGLKDELQDFTL